MYRYACSFGATGNNLHAWFDLCSPGSVLVTLDLGSEGFNNPEVLKSYLEEAIQTGLIGSYGVSKEGFSFKSLDGKCMGSALVLYYKGLLFIQIVRR